MRLLILLLSPLFLLSQKYNDAFVAAFKSGDFKEQEKILKKWEKSSPDDAELMMSQLSYYIAKAQNVSLTQKGKDESLNEANVSSKGLVSDGSILNTTSLGSEIVINQEMVTNGIIAIDRAIAFYPDRIEVRLAKVDAYEEIKDWANYANALIEIISYSKKNNNKWLENDDKPISDAKSYLFNVIQDCQVYLFEQKDTKVNSQIRKIALALLNHYPDHIESMTNISVSYINEKKLDEGLKYLLDAEVIAPEDSVVLTNLANVYFEKGNKLKAIDYYEKVIVYGNDKQKNIAKKKLIELKNKTFKTSNYHVIAGSYSTKVNALNSANEALKSGFFAKVLPLNQSGMYPVSYGEFAKEEDAKEFLNTLKTVHNIVGYISN